MLLGGRFIIDGSMTLGDFTAFTSYLGILIFPILLIGFMSNVIAQAAASHGRITDVLSREMHETHGTRVATLSGTLVVKDVSLTLDGRPVLKQVSFSVEPKTRTAIIGPTAAGKTQLLYLMTGLEQPTTGTITYDGYPLADYQKENFHTKVGLVFQDSSMFNLSIRENIAFSTVVDNEALARAVRAAELDDFLQGLPQGLDTIVSERGSSLSGGQKQRIMLARALALNPRVLLLDDFTARVDQATEKKILANVAREYPELTLISVTQKIAPVEHYDQIVVLMEGEVLAVGTHTQLMHASPEYVQIYESQQSTNRYD